MSVETGKKENIDEATDSVNSSAHGSILPVANTQKHKGSEDHIR